MADSELESRFAVLADVEQIVGECAMGNVINLNRFRKKKERDEQKKRAETNRRLHGRTKAERLSEAAQKSRLERLLGGARLVSDGASADDDEQGAVPPVEP